MRPKHITYLLSFTAVLVTFLFNSAQVHAGQRSVTSYSAAAPQACSFNTPYTPNISFAYRSTLSPPQIAGTTIENTVFQELANVNISPSPTPYPTATPIPRVVSVEPEPTPTPEIETSQESGPPPVESIPPTEGGNDPEVVFNLINQHRASKGLPAYQKDERLCEIAKRRQAQLQNEISGDGYIHQGFDAMDLEYYISEIMTYQPNEQAVLNWWLNSSLHRRGVESTQHTHTCGICSGTICIQLLSSFIPK